MGQRLVIQIEDDHGNRLANAYYHWSAYTGEAAELTNRVLGWLDAADPRLTEKQKAVWALYKTGARFNDTDRQYLVDEGSEKDYDFAFDEVKANRNSGLLSATEKGMDESNACEECRVTIYPDSKEIYFDTMIEFEVGDYIKMKEEYGEYWVPVDKMSTLSVSDHFEFSINKWKEFYSQLMQLLHANALFAISPDRKRVYEFIQ